MDLYEEFTAIIDALSAAKIDYAVCGGVAVALYGHPRFTKDIDFLIERHDREAVTAAVKQLGYDLATGSIPFDVGKPHQRELFRISKIADDEFLTLDFLLVDEVFREIWQARGVVAWESRQVCVVSFSGLIEMKRLAGRPQDKADIEILRAPQLDSEADEE